ncbi:uncharacterized protein M6B38_285210 [Iris pallida]|uniref:Uncharacterized protein n=1 Tax=Iris pallida TaxID=29817 RepID=A0AAX6F3G4_IRIPA|nr:uncharacterized protein M6B38_104995 [Iris pallida]KAJ6847175.1 uncharacterized protein M6B38_285210 [Iris pallida]
MACINMLNPDHHPAVPMSPRISFSNDFAVNDPPPPAAVRRDRMPVDPDFEFSVGSRPMMAADELFFKGRMLPLRGGGPGGAGGDTGAGGRLTTLRDELRSHEDYEGSRPPKASSSFFKLIGLKKPNCSNNNTTRPSSGEGGSKC